MSTAMILDLCTQALHLVMILSLPIVCLAAGVGLLVALLEAVTQIQEQSIATCAKIIAVFLLILFGSHAAGTATYNFADRLFQSIATIGTNSRQ